MQKQTVNKMFTTLLLSFALVLTGCSDNGPVEKSSEVTTEKESDADVIARVGDETITFSQLNTMLNSSAMVGLSIPALGTPERNQVMITLLDKVISANLIYLDAKKKGIDRLASYTEDVDLFEDAIIAALYKSKVMIGDTRVGEAEVLDYYNAQSSKETELTDDVKQAIESMIRKKKLDELKATLRDRLRENVDVVINENVLSVDYDDRRSDADVVASIDSHRISWGQVNELMRGADQRASLAAFYIDNDEERRSRLEQYLDNAIMAIKGRAAGLDKDPTFIKRTTEYRKTRLINVHRNGLIHSWNPSEDELKTYYVDNMDRFTVPEARKVQMVVVKTREEAESIKAQIDKGEITMYQAAQQYSIDPNAKHTLGDMGWVSQGTGFAGLDEFTFNLEPEVVSSPVESPAGWHLVKVLDVVDAQFENIDDPQTHQLVFRAYMKDRYNDYVVDQRKNHYDVAVYDEELQRQFQREADFIAELNVKARQQGSVTEKRVEELQKWITKPPT